MAPVTPRPALTALLGVEETAAASGGWRERLLEEAAELTRAGGWQSITMAKLADRVGVSRQTVYNEIGTKPSATRGDGRAAPAVGLSRGVDFANTAGLVAAGAAANDALPDSTSPSSAAATPMPPRR